MNPTPWWRPALDVLLPPLCQGCDRPLTREDWTLCGPCLNALTPPPEGCLRCGEGPAEGICPLCLDNPPPWDRLRSGVSYDEVAQQLVHAFKYGDRPRVAERLGEWMATWPRPEVDVIHAVPLHRDRLRSRGYNQAQWLARPLARGYKLPLEDLLERGRTSVSQASQAGSRRMENVADSYRLTGGKVEGRRVLLVDDVFTTGATSRACALRLKEAGAEWVEVWTFARARVGK